MKKYLDATDMCGSKSVIYTIYESALKYKYHLSELEIRNMLVYSTLNTEVSRFVSKYRI